jgi:enoyl-CoA hydratase
MTDGFVLVQDDARIPEVVLAGGRLTMTDITGLTGAVTAFGEGVRALVVRSSGADFCLGRAPSSGPKPAGPDERRDKLITPILDLYAAIGSAPFPVVAAVRGRTSGLGFALAGCCDVLLATENATFTLPEIDAGFAPLLALSRVARILPRQLAFHLASTAEPVTGARLWAMGVVAALASDAELDEAARRHAAALAERPAVGAIKTFFSQRSAAVLRADEAYAASELGAMPLGT